VSKAREGKVNFVSDRGVAMWVVGMMDTEVLECQMAGMTAFDWTRVPK